VQNAVGIDIEGDLDLRHSSRRGGNAHQLELAETLVVGGHLPLALQHLDLHLRLVVGGGGEGLRLWVDEEGMRACEKKKREEREEVGMVVFLLINLVNTPPRVSSPRERGVTSNSRMSFTSPSQDR
jgi:hypothetical protein